MNMPRLPRPLELGAVWYAVPLLWLCTAVVGWLLLSQWPQLFSEPLPVAAAALPGAADPASAYEGSDPSLPAASRVFAGSTVEPGPVIETF